MESTEKQAIIDEAKSKNKALYLYDIPSDEAERFILFRQAGPSDLQKFRENANHDQLQYTKESTLSFACVVYPKPVELTQIFQDWPGLPYALANEIWRQARGGDSVAKKV